MARITKDEVMTSKKEIEKIANNYFTVTEEPEILEEKNKRPNKKEVDTKNLNVVPIYERMIKDLQKANEELVKENKKKASRLKSKSSFSQKIGLFSAYFLSFTLIGGALSVIFLIILKLVISVWKWLF